LVSIGTLPTVICVKKPQGIPELLDSAEAAGRDTESLGATRSVDTDHVALALQAEEESGGRQTGETDSSTIEAIHDISCGAIAQAGPIQYIQARQTSVDLRVVVRYVSSGTLVWHSVLAPGGG